MKQEILEMNIVSGLFKGTGLDDFYTVLFCIAILLPVVTLIWSNTIKMDLQGIFKSFRTSAVVALVVMIVTVIYDPEVVVTNTQNNKILIVNDPIHARKIKKAYEGKCNIEETKELEKYIEELKDVK